jgi:competence protein ComEC
MVKWTFIGILFLVGILHNLWWNHRQPKVKPGDQVHLVMTIQAIPVRYSNIEIPLPYNTTISIGDKIEVKGTIQDKVIKNKHVGYVIKQASIQTLGHPSTFSNRILGIRQAAISRLLSSMPQEEAALATGLLLGGGSAMSRSLREAYQTTGLMHIVAASGYNVSAAAAWILVIINRIAHRRWGLIIGILGIWIYVLLAGGTASVVRAGIMVSFSLMGLFWGRVSDARWLLVITAMVMWIAKPNILTDIGWQLSLAATAGIVFLGPKGDLATTMAAQITTIPLILHYFGNLSLISPLANLTVLWAIPLGMQVSLLALLFGSPGGWIAWPVLKYVNSSVVWWSHVPGAAWKTNPVSTFWVIGYYLLLILIWVTAKRLRRS